MIAETVNFTVPGVAQTKGSTRAFIPKGWTRAIITNDNPKAKGWQQLIAEHASTALAASHLQPFADGPIALTVTFYLPRPQKFCIPKYATVDVPHTTKPDLDKLVRCCKDALTKTIWRDDAQVVDVVAHKCYVATGDLPRAVITIAAIPIPVIPSKPRLERPSLFGQEALYGEASTR